MHRQQQPDGRLGRPHPGEVVAHHRVGGEVGGAEVPWHALGASGPVGADGLGPGDERDDSRPPAMSEAARLTSHWGELPPMVVTSHRAPATPMRAASSVAGAGPGPDITLTTETRWIACRRAGTSARADPAARSMRSTAVTTSWRSIDWPDAMTTGVRSGSGTVVVIGSGGCGLGSRRKLPSPPCGGRSPADPTGDGPSRAPHGKAARRPRTESQGSGPRGQVTTSPTDSSSGWPPPGSRWRAATTARTSRRTTGWRGSRSVGSSPREAPSASGNGPRSRSTGPPDSAAPASASAWSGRGSAPRATAPTGRRWPGTRTSSAPAPSAAWNRS